MLRELECALTETFIGALIGSLPVLMHLVTLAAVKDGHPKALTDITPDILFLAITVAGNCAANAGMRMSAAGRSLGRAPIGIMACAIVVLALTAFLYGAYVGKVVDAVSAFGPAFWTLGAAATASLASDLVFAYRLSATAPN